MAGIGSHNTAPELVVRRALHAQGLRFRLHRKDLPGTPDIVLPRFKVAIFVHGCFWHRHRHCKLTASPTTNPHFWTRKFTANKLRDRLAAAALRRAEWRVIVVWECEKREYFSGRHLERLIRQRA